ncbi:hypothetical protein TgHK011_009437 [Trichoderma gracile]|nr:hypothetical protein TgHK011_009437 [Trichoderma gracile]
MEQFEFHDPTTRSAWQQTTPGIEELILNEDKSTGRKTLLQRWRPGAANPGATPFVHTFIEEVYIVEGDLTDRTLGQTFYKGMYAYRNPGMEHGPWEASPSNLRASSLTTLFEPSRHDLVIAFIKERALYLYGACLFSALSPITFAKVRKGVQLLQRLDSLDPQLNHFGDDLFRHYSRLLQIPEVLEQVNWALN